MSPLSESQLVRRVLELRESCADTEDFTREMNSRLSVSAEDATAIAEVLSDRFVSPEEQLDLLGRLELRNALSEGSSASGFISVLAGADGREALRHHARHLVDSLGRDPRGIENAPSADPAIEELTRLLPQGLGTVGSLNNIGSPLALGMFHYFRPEDSILRALVSELRTDWNESEDPVLRVRSARVLAGLGDRDAAAFIRESRAAFASEYHGDLGMDERIARASGFAADNDPVAVRFLRNVAMNPGESTVRRYLALSRLQPESLELDPDVTEVFRSLVEDPEEPVPTRYMMLLLLAGSPHPPAADWWQHLITDPSMTLAWDREASGGSASPGGFSRAEFSQWNLVLAALGRTSAPWAGEVLLEAAGNSGIAPFQRREALMAYILNHGSGSLPWENFREALGIAERPLGEMRLRFPHRNPRDSEEGTLFDLRCLGFIEKEYVLNLRETGSGVRILDFRPLNPTSDSLSPTITMADSEAAWPTNRRITLWPEVGTDPMLQIAEAEVDEEDAETLAPTSAPTPAPETHSNTQQIAASVPRSNHQQNQRGTPASSAETLVGI